MQTGNQPDSGAINPANDVLRLQDSIKVFQNEMEKLKAQAESARQQALDSIRKEILNAPGHLHFNTIENTQMQQDMPETNEDHTRPGAPANGAQAMQYSDEHMVQLLSNMSSQLQDSMKAAEQATTSAQQQVAGMAQAAEQAAAQAVEQGLHEQSEQEQTAESEMAKAQSAVTNAIHENGSSEQTSG